ncbi:hypothetical protein GWI33_008113 [Rhynchophorus ferrugineus]|uniref:Uncharacterized protein n=1 Tax=Rhynchophorus ferrugineus TaxID=354439 RepID=A0A834IIT8_RHYFE|nr:hypothetical protein GWI33_008113 [Rhynchophorus ferrugineus]
MSDPSCKFVLSEIVKLDQTLFSFTSFFPSLEGLSQKYDAKAYLAYSRRKRDLSTLLGLVNNSMIKTVFEHIIYILDHLDPCLYWLRGYVRFWIDDIGFKVVGGNINRFFDV